MTRRIIPILVCLFAAVFTSIAQPPQRRGGSAARNNPAVMQQYRNRAFISGAVVLSPDEEGGKEVPGTGVVVTVISGKDTLRAVTDETRGIFFLANIPVGKAYVSFALMGYKTQAKYVEIVPGNNRMIANLEPEPLEIGEAVIKESVAPATLVGDTIIFNAAAVKINKGEKAIDILEQMPGVTVTDNSVTVLDEVVKNVYVDGALLFGKAPMNALNNLDAEDVKTIKSYQEYANKDPDHKISKNESKERVLDIETKSKSKIFTVGYFLTGGGFDTDSTYHKFRYTLGGSFNLFSEALQAMAIVNVNNINDGSTRQRGNSFRIASGGGSPDLRSITVSANVNKRWMSPKVRNFELGGLSGVYSYSNQYEVNESVSQLLYFPDEQYTSREVNSSSYSDVTAKSHNFQVSGGKSLRDGRIGLNAGLGLSHNLSNAFSRNYTTMDGLAPQGTTSERNSTSAGRNYNVGLDFNKGWNNKFRASFNTAYSQSRNSSETAKTDSTTSTITYKVLDIDGKGDAHSFSVSPSVRYEINDYCSIGLGYSYNDTYRVTEQYAVNLTDPSDVYEDTVNSYTYTVDNNTHSTNLSFAGAFKNGIIVHVQTGYASVGLNKNETYPETDLYDKRFNAANSSLNIGTESMVNRWNLSISSSTSTPSVEQLRPRIDNSNLYSVTLGNSALKQVRTNKLDFSYSTPVGGDAKEKMQDQQNAMGGMNGMFGKPVRFENVRMLSFKAEFNARTAPIISRQTYFAKETYLPEYDYTMPAQSTLNTYENAWTASYSAEGRISYDTPIEKIGCLLTTSLEFDWDKTPSYLNSASIITQSYKPSASIGLRTNFSRNIRINLRLNGSYVNSENTLGNSNKYFNETINLGWELNNILKHLYAGGNYYKRFTQGLKYGSLSDNIMNINVGAKWGPKNNYDFNITVYDLFNTTTGFSTSLTSNYISNRWKHIFGRYVMAHFSYQFGRGGGGMRGR